MCSCTGINTTTKRNTVQFFSLVLIFIPRILIAATSSPSTFYLWVRSIYFSIQPLRHKRRILWHPRRCSSYHTGHGESCPAKVFPLLVHHHRRQQHAPPCQRTLRLQALRLPSLQLPLQAKDHNAAACGRSFQAETDSAFLVSSPLSWETAAPLF